MNKYRLKLSVALAGLWIGLSGGISSQDTTHQAFARFNAAAVSTIAQDSPTSATLLGDHRFDAQVTDMSAQGRARQLADERSLLIKLSHFTPAQLTRDDQVDAAVLRNELRKDIWQETVLKDWSWDPQLYNDLAGSSLYGLSARDFAPWPQRLNAATARMLAIPHILAAARTNLVPTRVPEIFAATVAKQNGGIVDIAETMLKPHEDTLSPQDRVKFEAALKTLKAAVAAHQVWLDKTLLPQAHGSFRLGAQLYDAKLHFALDSPLDRQTIKARAAKAFADTRSQMYQIARQVLAGHTALALPEQPNNEQQQAAIVAALDLTYAHRPARAAIEDIARKNVTMGADFVRTHDLLTLPSAPVKIIEMPKFQQGVAVAYCDPPGPLDSNLPTFYAVSPIPDDWTQKQADSFLREYNDYMMQDLSIHEAMPGHYVQLAHANGASDPLRAVFYSSPFVEGWAVYAEGMMADEGYLNNDPLFKLTVLKMRLRSISNSLLDIGIQTEGMTEQQAMTLMMQGAFQQEREAAGKWTRARLTSAQLLSYFVGYSEHMALREEAKRRWGTTYSLKRYNEAVLSHGSPATHYVRSLMFDLPV